MCTCYRIAGNFRGCKFSRKCLQTLQKKFSWFLFSWGVPAVPHPSYVRTYTTSRDTRWVKNFVVFIFAVPCRSAKTAKICTPRKFPAIRYSPTTFCCCHRESWFTNFYSVFVILTDKARKLTEFECKFTLISEHCCCIVLIWMLLSKLALLDYEFHF